MYVRKSREDKGGQALSLESQIRELKEYAFKEKLEVVDILQESQTAYKPGRPVFAQMMEIFEQKLANAVLVWKPDRISRNALDGGKFIQAMDDGKILELRTPVERFGKDDNRMMLYVHVGMSNEYSKQISVNVKRGNRQKYARGEFCGAAPLGYLNVKVGDSRNIDIDPEKGPLVKKLFTEYATGKYCVRSLVELAEKWGLRSIHGKKIVKSGMHLLLSQTAYYGVFRHGGEPHQGVYEPLISKELFNRVQSVLRDRSKPRKRTWSHTYRGLLKCGECGCAITAETKHKHYKGTNRDADYTYYRCTKKHGRCFQRAIKGDVLEEMFNKMVENISIDKEAWDLGVKLLRKKYEAELGQQDKIRQNWQREYNSVKEKLGKLLEMRMKEEITAEEYLQAKQDMLSEQSNLKEKLDDEHGGSMQWLELAEKFFENCYQGREIMKSDDSEVKKALIQTIGSNLVLKDEKLGFTLKKPYDVLLKPQIRSDVQG